MKMPWWCFLFHWHNQICAGPYRWRCGKCGREWGKGYKYDDVAAIHVDQSGKFLGVSLKD